MALPADRVLVRHAELGVKSDQVRRKMEARLADNIAAILADRDLDGQVERRRNRLFVDAPDLDAAADAATDAFGVASASPVLVVDPTLDAVCEGLAAATRACYDGGSFAVRGRRAGDADEHPFTSQDVEQSGGSAVWEAIEDLGGEPVVDLVDPGFEAYAEVRPDEAYVFVEKRPGPAGLPVGTQRPLVAMVSGGIDSPVAAWKVMKRGSPIVPVYVDLGEYGGPDHRARAEATVADLATYAPNLDWELRVVPGGPVVSDLADATHDTRMIHLRRFVVAVGAAIAEDVGAVGVVTGEAIGQKSSQTTANLAATDAAVDLAVHRPNLTADKAEITDLARTIGTFEQSTIPTGCNRVAPSFPETAATLEEVRAAEPDDLLERARAVAAEAEVVAVERPAEPTERNH